MHRPCYEGEKDGTAFWEELHEGASELEGAEEGFERPKLRLSVAAVWARCPLLRPVIKEHFTAKSAMSFASAPVVGMPTMCLAVDASYEALSCITRYVRSRVLLCPSLVSTQDLEGYLELMKLSDLWGMSSLLEEVGNVCPRAKTDTCSLPSRQLIACLTSSHVISCDHYFM